MFRKRKKPKGKQGSSSTLGGTLSASALQVRSHLTLMGYDISTLSDGDILTRVEHAFSHHRTKEAQLGRMEAQYDGA